MKSPKNVRLAQRCSAKSGKAMPGSGGEECPRKLATNIDYFCD